MMGPNHSRTCVIKASFMLTVNACLWKRSSSSPSSSCSFPQPAGSVCTVQHTERSSHCCDLNCSPAQRAEPETGCNCRLYVVSPAWRASARTSNTAPRARSMVGGRKREDSPLASSHLSKVSCCFQRETYGLTLYYYC